MKELRRRFQLAFPLTLLGMLLVAATAQAAYLGDLLFLPPHADYKTIETDHFEVIYPKVHETEAHESARYLEEAHGILSTAFKYSPGHKCKVILTDNSDFANGVTSVVGRQGIVLYLTAPDPYSSIGEYDHWLRNLIIHEYAHYVTLEQRRGVFDFLRFILGDLVYPNQMWPTWLAEGMAVHAESAFTKWGRGQGTYYATITRDGLARGRLGDKLLDFSSLMGPIPDFPFGEGQYYAGYAMIDEMMARHGEDALARFSEESSWRVPFFFNNGTLENISQDKTSQSFQELWSRWVARRREQLEPELRWLRSHGAPDPRFLSEEGTSALGTRLSPDGKRVLYALGSGHERPSVYVADVDGQKRQKLDDAVSGGGLAWSHDGSKVYYAKVDFRGPLALYAELYEQNARGGSIRRLTRGERAKDPDYCAGPGLSPRLVYTTHRGRLSELRSVELSSGKVQVLYQGPAHHHISNPRCTPDGKRVLFAMHGTEPFDAIYEMALDAKAKPQQRVGGPKQGFSALFPEPTAEGGFYFTRAAQGYYELARLEAGSALPRLVARSSGGYWFPSVARNAPSRLSVSYVSSTGIRAAVLDDAAALERRSTQAPELPSGKPAHAKVRGQPQASAPPLDTKISEPRDYNLLGSLAPRLWSPFLSFSDYQNQYGFAVAGWDDLDQLEYLIWPWYDSASRKPEGIFQTFHRIGTFKASFGASSQVSRLVPASANRRLFDQERKLGVSLQRPFPGVFTRFTPTVLAEWARTYRDGDFGRRVFSPELRLGVNLNLDWRQRFAYSIAAEEGGAIGLMGRRFFTSRFQAWKGLANWDQLVPLFPRHSSLRLNGYFAVAPMPTSSIPESLVRVGGIGTLSDLDPPLRGYPLGNFETQRAAIVQAEYRLPLAQIFKGIGTWPLFFRNISLYGFFDGAKLQERAGGYGELIGGTGGGLLINTELGYLLPAQLRVEFAHGLRQDLNGQNSFTVQAAF